MFCLQGFLKRNIKNIEMPLLFLLLLNYDICLYIRFIFGKILTWHTSLKSTGVKVAAGKNKMKQKKKGKQDWLDLTKQMGQVLTFKKHVL